MRRRRPGRSEAILGREATNDAYELLGVEWLAQIRLGVAPIGLVTWICDTGEDDERDVTERLAKLAREGRSIDAGHLDVEHDDGRRVGLQDPQRLSAIARLDDAEPAVGQDRALGVQRLDVVVDDQHGPRAMLEYRHGAIHASAVPTPRRGQIPA